MSTTTSVVALWGLVKMTPSELENNSDDDRGCQYEGEDIVGYLNTMNVGEADKIQKELELLNKVKLGAKDKLYLRVAETDGSESDFVSFDTYITDGEDYNTDYLIGGHFKRHYEPEQNFWTRLTSRFWSRGNVEKGYYDLEDGIQRRLIKQAIEEKQLSDLEPSQMRLRLVLQHSQGGIIEGDDRLMPEIVRELSTYASMAKARNLEVELVGLDIWDPDSKEWTNYMSAEEALLALDPENPMCLEYWNSWQNPISIATGEPLWEDDSLGLKFTGVWKWDSRSREFWPDLE